MRTAFGMHSVTWQRRPSLFLGKLDRPAYSRKATAPASSARPGARPAAPLSGSSDVSSASSESVEGDPELWVGAAALELPAELDEESVESDLRTAAPFSVAQSSSEMPSAQQMLSSSLS